MIPSGQRGGEFSIELVRLCWLVRVTYIGRENVGLAEHGRSFGAGIL